MNVYETLCYFSHSSSARHYTVTLLFNLLSIQTTDLLHLGNIQYRKAVKCDNTYERHEKPETIIYIGTQQ